MGVLVPGMADRWQPGDPLTAADRVLLASLVARAAELGYTPTKAEVANASQLKYRFRTWGNAVRAAGLPWVNYPDQQRLRRAKCQAQSAPDPSPTDSGATED
jgi:hypothetical protein